MKVTPHQQKEKDEETKTGKRKAEEERKQATDFKKAAFRPSAVVQGAVLQKMVCVSGEPAITGTFGKANIHFDLAQTGSGTAPPHCGCC